jgi:hypothetical protein
MLVAPITARMACMACQENKLYVLLKIQGEAGWVNTKRVMYLQGLGQGHGCIALVVTELGLGRNRDHGGRAPHLEGHSKLLREQNRNGKKHSLFDSTLAGSSSASTSSPKARSNASETSLSSQFRMYTGGELAVPPDM